ncbi:hypothetical protein [Burkholderia sp. Bp8963]|nr:hypothetical protein [Burkholderia sp. Bp8963]
MDSAQDKFTGEIVEAEQLWLILEVDKDRCTDRRNRKGLRENHL